MMETWRRRLGLRFREGVTWSRDAGGAAQLTSPSFSPISLGALPQALLAAFERLDAEGPTLETLTEGLAAQDGPLAVATLLHHLRRLEQLALLAYVVRDGETTLSSLYPISPWFSLGSGDIDPARRYVLSRFAYQRRDGEGLVLESPRCHALLRIEDAHAAALCFTLARPTTPATLAVSGASPDAMATFVSLLVAAGFVIPAEDSGRTEEEQAFQLASWSFHDLLFHARSRPGRHSWPCGKTYPFRDRVPPPPALRPPRASAPPPLPLPRPDLDALRKADRPFTAVLEGRRTVRAQGRDPLSVEQLGEFLYRSARVRALMPATPASGYDVTSRPSPSGGACHDLEIYLAIDRCRGLDAGLYHYDPAAHALSRIQGRTPEVTALLTGAALATLRAELPQVLICLASRFQRVSWSYEGISYSVTLKNVGALYQTFYLVATTMGLACSGVGRGDSDLFCKAAGTEYYAETSVGEFVLGSRPEEGEE
ncbi:SagB family peptide dehydrogenase [Polyangium sorediatum]|uniref:SagB family peptide dehydrogenase n=1 Tax=Polyangium sorediatum TaxID=889274 RepID=A0ABT6NJR0_9BACT|nr:SagB family peptide dehydrogenase [Polyangium sorediatum]MDI1428545.1 SagB family peptide dehydrogenase [Polyangium sorediatum]